MWKRITHRLANIVLPRHAEASFSQEGEDMLLRRIFEGQSTGFYVDVGAHHPERFSNTNYFYRRGWRGINVEPNPDASNVFAQARSRDINLQCGIAEKAGSLKYYRFDEPALNSFDSALVENRLLNTHYRVVQEIVVPVVRLDHILENHLPAGMDIDFLTIDVEGFDLQVLKSNDWDRFRPVCVLAELLSSDLEDVISNEVFVFLKSHGYKAFSKTLNTWIFKRAQ
jgi:FkbM family methyltransferase